MTIGQGQAAAPTINASTKKGAKAMLSRLLPITNYRLSFVDRHVFLVAGADVFGTRTDQFVVRVLFENVSRPTRNARNSEDRRVLVERNVHQIIGRSRIEIDVRV